MFLFLLLAYSGFSNAVESNMLKKNTLQGYRANPLSVRVNSLKGSNKIVYFDAENLKNNSTTESFSKKSLKIGAEFLAGSIGELVPIGFSWLALSYNGGVDDDDLNGIFAVNIICSSILVGPLTWGCGKYFNENPSFWKTELGAIAGGIVGMSLWKINEPEEGAGNQLNWLFLMLTPLGATIGANL